jgi:hypothetical protein
MEIFLITVVISYVLLDAFIIPKIEQKKEDEKWEKILSEYNKTALVKAKLV